MALSAAEKQKRYRERKAGVTTVTEGVTESVTVLPKAKRVGVTEELVALRAEVAALRVEVALMRAWEGRLQAVEDRPHMVPLLPEPPKLSEADRVRADLARLAAVRAGKAPPLPTAYGDLEPA